MAAAPPRVNIPALTSLDLVIETARVRLRPFTVADVEAVWPFVSDSQVPLNMSWAAHADRGETAAWIERTAAELAAGTGITWAIEHAEHAVGCVSLMQIQWHVRAVRVDRAELVYWIGPPLWGQGLMSEAVDAVVRFGFGPLGLHKINVGCLVDNTGSRRVIEKTGFRFIGELQDDVWLHDAWRAHLRYELTAPDWPDVHTTMRIARP